MMRRIRELIGQAPGRIARDAGEYWAASRDDAGKRSLSHWRGEGAWADEERWLGIGRANRASFGRLRHFAGEDGPFAVMAEWGPGGGSNALAFLPEFSTYHGIDISAANLEECARQVAREGHQGFQAHLFPAETPDVIRSRISEPLDFFLSTAVFQHFPGKEYGAAVTRVAFDLLRPGGLALIQTRFDDGNERFRPRRANYRENAVTFTSYALEEFWDVAEQAGFEPLYVTLVRKTNYACYGLRRPR